MALEVVMPKLGLNMTEGLLVEWLKKEGERVERGDPLFIVETDKVTTESTAQASGVLTGIRVQAGEIVPVKTVVALIETEEDTAPAPAQPGLEPVRAARVETEAAAPLRPVSPPLSRVGLVLASPVAKRIAKEHGIDLAAVSGTGPGGRIVQEDVERAVAQAQAAASPVQAGRVPASPVAKRLAREHGIDLASIKGTGAEGRITQEDVERAIQTGQAAQAASAPPAERAAPYSAQTGAPALKTVPIEGIRAVVARRMSRSVQTTAQVTLHTEFDASAMVAYRSRLKAEAAGNGAGAPSYNAILASAAAQALRSHPYMNATQVGDEIHYLEPVNIGLAVDTDAGLVVVVVKDADRKPVQAIHSEMVSLVDRAQVRKCLPDELEGSTFTITNLGMYGVDGFTPIINPPEIAILGVGRIVEKLVIREGKVMQRHMLNLSLTFDHRLVDGAPAARFLQTLCGLLEEL